jgi:hypothetical protein
MFGRAGKRSVMARLSQYYDRLDLDRQGEPELTQPVVDRAP